MKFQVAGYEINVGWAAPTMDRDHIQILVGKAHPTTTPLCRKPATNLLRCDLSRNATKCQMLSDT